MNLTPSLQNAADAILTAIAARLPERKPLLVTLDGGSGAGKSTLARRIADTLDAAWVPGDDFLAANVSNAEWDERTPAQRAADVIDWRRLRKEALEPLLRGEPARWHAFDFKAQRPDGTFPLSAEWIERQPADVIVLDGIYSTRAELADLVGLSVLADVPITIRHARLAAREDAAFLAEWHARWDAAEAYYLTTVRPPASFDLVVTP